MAFNAKSIIGIMDLDNRPHMAAIGQAKRGATDFKNHATKELNSVKADGFKRTMSDLKGSLGKGSMLGQSLKMAMGGGALMGVSMAGNMFKDLTANITESTASLKAGKITLGEYADKMASSLPILGSFFEAGRNIREMITGEEAALRKLIDTQDAFTKRMNETRAVQQQYKKEGVDAQKALAESRRRANETTDMMKIPEGPDRQIQQIKNEQNEKGREAWAKASSAMHLDKIAGLESAIAREKDPNVKKNLENQLMQLNKNHERLMQEYYETAAALTAEGEAKIAEVQGKANADKQKKQKEAMDAIAAMREAAAAPINELNKANRQAGMSEFAKQFDDFKNAKDSTGKALFSDEELTKAKAVLDQAEKLAKDKGLDEKIKTFKESMITPAEQLQKTIDELAEWESAGKITAAEFDRGVDAARKSAFGDTGEASKLPSMVMAGSAEAMAARFDGGGGKDMAIGIQKKQLTTQEATLREIEKLNNKINDKDAVVSIFE